MKRKEDPWRKIIENLDDFIKSVNQYTDIYGCAHLILPSKTCPEFIAKVQERGYSMKRLMGIDKVEFLNKNHLKKVSFYEITKK